MIERVAIWSSELISTSPAQHRVVCKGTPGRDVVGSDRYRIQTVIIDPNVALSAALRNDNEWSKVYEDDQAVIFTRSSK